MKNIDLLTLKLERHKLNEEFEVEIKSNDDAGEFFIKMIGNKDRENFVLVGIDVKGRINNYAVAHIGTLDTTIITPRDVFKYPLLSNSNMIIVAHNHPSGDLKPSKADLRTTKMLVEAGDLIGVKVVDHIIVSDKGYISLRRDYGEIFLWEYMKSSLWMEQPY